MERNDTDAVTTENPRAVARREYLRALAKRKDRLNAERQWWKENTPPGDGHGEMMVKALNILIWNTAELARKIEHRLMEAPQSYAIGTLILSTVDESGLYMPRKPSGEFKDERATRRKEK